MKRSMLALVAVLVMVPLVMIPTNGFAWGLGDWFSKKEETQLDNVVRTGKKKTYYRKETLGYDVSVNDISSNKKDSFKVDLRITSTVPVNVSMKDDRVVVQQAYASGRSLGGKRMGAGEVISIDMSDIGKRSRKEIYKVPTWPLHAKPFEDKDKIEIGVRYRQAGNSFSSKGHTQDLSKLIFGEKSYCTSSAGDCHGSIYIRDILLASKLVELEQVTDFSGLGGQNYLADVAGQRICFDASQDELRIDLGYVRHFRNNDISVGIDIPFVFKKHNLKLTTTASSVAENNEAFMTLYGDCFKEFVKDILCKKDSSLTEGDTESGIGDVSAFINFEINSSHAERILLGFKVLFPTAKDRNIHKLWDPELGNGGFTELTAFGSLMFNANNFFNPHFLVQGTYSLQGEVTRRIPSYKKYEETTSQVHELGQLLAMGELVRTIVGTTNFTMLDTVWRRFSTEAARIRVRKGAEFFFRVGNMWEKFISNYAFLDFYYDVRLKGTDHLSTKDLNCLFAPTLLTENTFQVEHRAGGTFTYQFDEHVRAMVGGLYTFAGRNVPKTMELNASIEVEF